MHYNFRIHVLLGAIVEFVGQCVRSIAIVIKTHNDWRGVGRPKVAMHSNCHFSYLFNKFLCLYIQASDCSIHVLASVSIYQCSWTNIAV